MTPAFRDRAAAGQALADALAAMPFPHPPVVLALPRGGVPVAAEVARRLHAPLDLLLVRKIGVPWQPELAMAAVVEGDPPELVADPTMAHLADADYLRQELAVATREIARRRALYLAGHAPLPLAGRTAIVVDDGIATGATVRAALQGLRRRGPAALVLAVPLAPADTLARLRPEVDTLVCLRTPEPFIAVGHHYARFDQVEDDEVMRVLQSMPGPAGAPGR